MKGNKMNINEVKEFKNGSFTAVEVYKATDNGYYSSDFHGDFIVELEDYTGKEEVKKWTIMDEEDYNNSILANCSVEFEEIYEKNDKILVIVIEQKEKLS